jgi:hypothetical protein
MEPAIARNVALKRPNNSPPKVSPNRRSTMLVRLQMNAFWTGKDLANVDTAKKMAGGATIGAAAALIAPIGIVTGAAIGAGIVAYRHLNKKNDQK